MKIGIFDSGRGGLVILRSIATLMPEYDYVYFGDEGHMPYGQRTQKDIYRLTKEAVDFLFKKDCAIVILACNTASSSSLRRLQREWLPKFYPDRKLLGVLVPTVEAALAIRVGVMATPATVKSHAYVKELKKIHPELSVFQTQSKHLASYIDRGDVRKAEREIVRCAQRLLKHDVQEIILGCTHYGAVKSALQGLGVKVVAQEDIVPKKLKAYLQKHNEVSEKLSRKGRKRFFVSVKGGRILEKPIKDIKI